MNQSRHVSLCSFLFDAKPFSETLDYEARTAKEQVDLFFAGKFAFRCFQTMSTITKMMFGEIQGT